MCGIAGLWSPFTPSRATRPHAEAMAERLHHRGPDGRGFRARGVEVSL